MNVGVPYILAMARRTRKKPQFQVELDRLMCEVEGEDCAATDTHKVTEGPEPVGNCRFDGKTV